MNILITGATGFVGNNLVRCLIPKITSKEDTIIVLCSSIPDTKEEKCVYVSHDNWNYTVDDFRNAGIEKIDIIVHLGWFVAKNSEEQNDFKKNVYPLESTYYLLEHLPNIPKKIIFGSSTSIS